MRDIIRHKRERERRWRCIWVKGDVQRLFGGLRGTNHQESHVAESATGLHQAESLQPFPPTTVSLHVLECRLRAVSATPVFGAVTTEQPIAHIMNRDWM